MRHYRRNPDPLRYAERACFYGGPEEHSRLLVARLRAGTLSREGVIWAARLGHPAALLLMPDAEPVDWRAERREAIQTVSKLAGGRRWQRVVTAFAVDCAERALPVFEASRPGDNRPRRALNLARSWAEGKRVSKARLRAAVDTVAAAAYTFDAAAWAAYAAARAARSAETAAETAAAYAGAAASYAAAAYAASEREWQRLRLAQYALGET